VTLSQLVGTPIIKVSSWIFRKAIVKMGALSQETQLVQNPALGAMLLWRFASGYERRSNIHSYAPLPLLFLVLPVTLHQETARFIASTRQASGLRAFVNKFSDSSVSKSDVLLAINDRAVA
jgi:hypothetical protein